MMLDLNNFKALNETYGHIVGDQALLLAAEQITQSVRPYDWAARWGDDEFLVVLPHTDVIQAEAIGNRILSRIRKISISVPEKETLQINASIGIITTSKINDGIDLIIQSANEVLNSAKNGGNDCIFVRDLQSLAK
jgi:diguanylate cyclase (GGDEF)-like protein